MRCGRHLRSPFDGGDAGRQVRGSADTAGTDHSAIRFAQQAVRAAGFTCAEGLCLARHPSGAIVAHALDARRRSTSALPPASSSSTMRRPRMSAAGRTCSSSPSAISRSTAAPRSRSQVETMLSDGARRASPPRSNTRSAGRSVPGTTSAVSRARRAGLRPIGGRTSRQSPAKSRRLRSPGSRTQLHQPKLPIRPFRKPAQ